jgi:hypothetical protein
MEPEEKALQVYIFMFIIILGAIMLYQHDRHSKKLEELKQLQLEKIEKEKNVIGYWVMNSLTCQYEYVVKI